jgi:adenosylcobinamide-phosphate synthase
MALAFLLDLLVGDPRWFPHPVVLMGILIERAESFLRRKSDSGRTEYIKGAILVIMTISITMISLYIILWMVNNVSGLNRMLAEVLMVFLASTTLATRGLITSAMSVLHALDNDDLESSRKLLSMIVGRDTGHLDRQEIQKATIETLSENLSDGVIAPLFYLGLGGLPLAMAYKAVNTMDSMIGYRNQKYRYFGYTAARLDDIANFIPARLTGMLIALASFLYLALRDMGTATAVLSRSLKVMILEGKKHLSPNSGIPEAAISGALGMRLGGPSFYNGRLVEKPYIGTDSSGNYEEAGWDALRIVSVAAVLGGVLMVICRWLVLLIMIWHF